MTTINTSYETAGSIGYRPQTQPQVQSTPSLFTSAPSSSVSSAPASSSASVFSY